MIKADQARQRMQEADPVPTLHAVTDELVGSVRAIIDAEVAGQSAPGRAAPARGERDRDRQWRRPLIAVAAAFALTVASIGVVGLFRTSETPVGNLTTTLSPTTLTTGAPETTLPATTLAAVPPPTAPAATTIPPKPASLEISWQRVPEQPALEDGWISAVAKGESEYVAVGGTVGCSDPLSPNCLLDAAVWISADGLTWERIESQSFRGDTVRETSHGTPLDGDQYMNDVAFGQAGFVAVGAAPIVDPERPSGYIERSGIWISPDGRQWERLPYDDEVFGGVGELARIATLGDRFVVVSGPRAWLSDTGTDWERVAIDSSSSAWVGDLTVWNGVLVGVGALSDSPAVWMSEDGATWTRAEDADLAAASGNLQGVGGNAAGLVALGTDFSAGGKVTAWRSADGLEWTVAPEWLSNNPEWQYQSRTAVSVGRGTGGIEEDLVLINGGYRNGSATLWGTADGGEHWYSAGEFAGGALDVLASSASSVFSTINQVLLTDDQLLAFGKVVAWSGTEPIGGLCYIDPGDGSMGSCRADAAIWVGTWDDVSQ